MKKRGISWDVRKEYQANDFFTGVSLTLHVSLISRLHTLCLLLTSVHSG